MPAHPTPADPGLSVAVASMGAALLKSLPTRRWVHERQVQDFGDMDAFQAADESLAASSGFSFAEMGA